MSVPPPIIEAVEHHTGLKISGFFPASGGCINNGGRITTSGAELFIKWNDAAKFPGMFHAERSGLNLLRQSDAFVVPNVVQADIKGSYQFLLLEYIRNGTRTHDYWEYFGRGLATLHQQSSATFGLDHNNYIGSLPQRNTPATSWTEFFIDCRLETQLRLAIDNKAMDKRATGKFAELFKKLPSLIPVEPPSLLHGDLWSGNIIVTGDGQPCLIDPAVYYGHREVDLAMTQLFGGFDDRFIYSYDEVFPLSPGYQKRVDLYNLYPLLVHANLFGAGYGAQVVSILGQYV